MRKRRRETWTFQPEDDVKEAVRAVFGENPDKVTRTAIINEALRLHHNDSIIMTAEREIAEAIGRLEFIRKKVAEHKTPPHTPPENGDVHLNKTQGEVDRVAERAAAAAIALLSGETLPFESDAVRRKIVDTVKREVEKLAQQKRAK